ncbi:MAG: 16S rRNA (cytosine(967)-C(5))-methyltransferase RsmB [Gammaproteobacteria bacterium]|nr:16S rRNA (cytosine(967)-C(5))-methyltransferase RsmB [Gammaproteobacteria bacterium]
MYVFRDGLPLSASLELACGGLSGPRERRLARELAYGVMRWWPRLAATLAELLDHPLKRKDLDIEVLILLGLYQLLYTRIPPHAAVAETVAMTRSLRKSWASGLANATLRRFDRERQTLLARIEGIDAARFAHPDWLIGELRDAWPGEWKDILVAANARPPMTLRVNARRGTRGNYMEALGTAGVGATSAPFTDFGVILDEPVDVDSLPGFRDGLVSVQDAAAQLAAPLLSLEPGHRVLDACAAPGGKTAHILETGADLSEVVALDASPERVARLKQTLERLSLKCRVVHADATQTEDWWDGKPFDRILLDTPCTATGIIRRQPDIKFRRSPKDLSRLKKIQSELLESLWPLLARGGLLLYATCSVLPQENRQRVAEFLSSRTDVEIQPIDSAWGRPDDFGRQILTGEHGMDGFYYALLAKR